MLVQATFLETGDILFQHIGLITVCSVFGSLFKVDCDSVKKTLKIIRVSKPMILAMTSHEYLLDSESGKHLPGSLLW